MTLRTGPLGDAFDALNQCTRDLLKDWGLDPDKHLTARQLPQWENEQRITRRIQAVYPSAAIALGEEGIMRMRVIIDEAGAVSQCKIVSATETQSLQSTACKAMKDARFSPALDAQGQPFKSFYTETIVYRING